MLLALLLARPVGAEDDDDAAVDDRPHITVCGTASAAIAPNLATLRLGVNGDRPDPTATVEACAATPAALVEATKVRGIVPADIVPDPMNRGADRRG